MTLIRRAASGIRTALRRSWGSAPRRGVALLAGSTALGQILTFAATPFLTRIYGPGSFGVYTFLISVAGVVAVASTLRLEMVVPIAPSMEEARAVVRVSLAACVIFACGAGLTTWYVQDLGLDWWSVAPHGWVPVAIAALTFLLGLFAILTQMAMRERQYGRVARRGLTQAIGTVAGQFTIALWNTTGSGLVAGQLVGRSLGIATLGWQMRDYLRRSPGNYVSTLRRFSRFPVVFMPSAVINALGTQLPLLLVGSLYGLSAAGQLGVGQRLVAAPMALLGVSIGRVFGAELAARVREGRLDNRRLYLRTTVRLLAIAIPLILAALTLPPLLDTAFLGPEWSETGPLMQGMALAAGLGLVASPLSRVFSVYERARASAMVDLTRPLLVAGLGLLLYSLGANVVTAVWAMFSGQAINYILTWVVGFRISRGRAK